MFDEAISVYKRFSEKSKAQADQLSGVAMDEAQDDDPVEAVDLKRNRGVVLQKLGKIYQNEHYKLADMELAIQTYKLAIKLVHGFNNK